MASTPTNPEQRRMSNTKGMLNRLSKLETLLGDADLLGGVDMCRTIDEFNGKFNWLEPEVFARRREDRQIGKELEGLQRGAVRQREKIEELEVQLQVLREEGSSAPPGWMERVEQLDALVGRFDVLVGEKEELTVRLGSLEKERDGHVKRIERLEKGIDKETADVGLPEVTTSEQPDRAPASQSRNNAPPSTAGRPLPSMNQAYGTPFTSLIDSIATLAGRLDRREHADNQRFDAICAHIGQLQNVNTAHVTVTQTANGRLDRIHNRTVLLERKAEELDERVAKCSDQLEHQLRASPAAEHNERIDALTASFDALTVRFGESERRRECVEGVNEKRLETLIGDNAQMCERTKRVEAAVGLLKRMTEDLDVVKKEVEGLATRVEENKMDIQRTSTSVESLEKEIDVSSENSLERAKQECEVLEQRLHERLHKAEKYLKNLKHKGEAQITRLDDLTARVEAQRRAESGRWVNLAAHIGSLSAAEEPQLGGPSTWVVPQWQAENEQVGASLAHVSSLDVAAAAGPTIEVVTQSDQEVSDEVSESDGVHPTTPRVTRATVARNSTPVIEAMDIIESNDSEHPAPHQRRPTWREKEMKNLEDTSGWTQAKERMQTVDADMADASEGPRRSAREPKPVELPGDMLDWHAARARMKADVPRRERPRKIIVSSCSNARDKTARGKAARQMRTEKGRCRKGSGR